VAIDQLLFAPVFIGAFMAVLTAIEVRKGARTAQPLGVHATYCLHLLPQQACSWPGQSQPWPSLTLLTPLGLLAGQSPERRPQAEAGPA
jgi:hypothetical protein